ncbi:MAG TPA: class I SAM-dependent methyltransferase [Burkholderiales bacterium]|nr:class I SAM-dependent methyltransferase [Burkholderiales bacterium]
MLRGGKEAEDELHWLRTTLYSDCLDAIVETTDPGAPVLDIGCGVGHLVQYLSANGASAEGIEPSSDAVQVARERGLKAEQSTLEGWAGKPENAGRYRAVTLLNVLEHVPDPVRFLTLARSLVQPGGVVVFRVPNDFSEIQEAAQRVTQRQYWWVAAPDHINYFSPESVGTTCDAVGLEPLEITADFPMEAFLLFGVNYVDAAERGKEAHRMRCNFELNLPKALRRKIYRALSAVGVGRDLLVVARRPRSDR